MSVPPPSCTPNSTSTGIGEQRRHVGDRGVEHDHRRAQRRQPAEHAGEQRGVHDAAGHRPALVDGDDDVAGQAALVPAVADEPLGDDGALLGQPVAQVGVDRARPVDVGRARAAGAAGPGERAAHGLAGAVGEALLELAEHRGDDLAGRRPGLVGQGPVELDEQRDEVQVGLQLVEQLRLEQQLAEVEALDGVALQHLHDRRREVAADVAEPAGDRRRRAGQAAGAPAAATARRLAVVRARRARRRCAGRRRAGRRPCRRRRRRRAPAASGAAARARTRRAVTVASRGARPSIARTVASPASRPGLVDVVAHRRRPLDRGPSPAGRRAGGARPARRRRTCAAAGPRRPRTASARAATTIQPSTAASSWVSCSSTVPLPARKPSTNAAPLAAGVPGVSARPRRASTAGGAQWPASWSSRVARPCTSPWRATALGELLEHGRQLAAPGRVVDDGRAAAWAALSRSIIWRAASSSSALGGASQPGDDAHDELVEHDPQVGDVGAPHVAVAQGAGERAEGVHQLADVGVAGGQHAEQPARPAAARRAGRRAGPGRRRPAASTSRAGRGDVLDEARRRRRLDRRAVAGQLDDAHRQLGLPRQAPRLAERAARAAALLERAPRDAERGQPVQQVRAAQAVRRAQVELDGARRRPPA